MSQLYQMQVTYAPVEDRLLFRVNTKQRQEFRFWLTRRYVALLWKAILDHLRSLAGDQSEAEDEAEDEGEQKESETAASAPPKKKATPKPLQDAILAKEHEEQVAQSDFKTQYQESTYLPLGEQPLLLHGIGIKKGPEGNAILCMQPQKGEGIEISLNGQITHSLCRLLADATKTAEWGLDLDFNQARRYLSDQEPGLN